MIECKIISGMEKILLSSELNAKVLRRDVAARGELYSFQVALRSDCSCWAKVDVESDLDCRVRQVGHVPVLFPGLPEDKDVLNQNQPGLYPDPLNELDAPGRIKPLNGIWKTLWISVRIKEDQEPGIYPVTVHLTQQSLSQPPVDQEKVAVKLQLEVLDFALPPQKLIRFEWFHPDCLADFYHTAPWSEEHWRIVENFAGNAFAHGINMLYTPLWTPPLDTAVGRTRTTCQLLEITYDHKTGKYEFDFTRLRRFLAMGRKIGFRHFSMTHLFSQWGAAKAPHIVARVVNDPERPEGIYPVFGWDKDSTGPEYSSFLKQLMPRLISLLREEKLDKEHCFFSLSDEPGSDILENYRKVVNLARPLLEEYETVEALSHYDYYEEGLVQNPVPSISVIDQFIGRTKKCWGYYCCGPVLKAPNRFISMPSRRTRTFGTLAYLYKLEGFLHWGFNFYNSQFSLKHINPFICTDADGAFSGGDAFLVYPGPDGKPVDSIRHEIFTAGLQDMRALQLLESRIGRPAVVAILQKGRKKPIKMLDFPNTPDWLMKKRREIYQALAENR